MYIFWIAILLTNIYDIDPRPIIQYPFGLQLLSVLGSRTPAGLALLPISGGSGAYGWYEQLEFLL